jgi:hypothetical protein
VGIREYLVTALFARDFAWITAIKMTLAIAALDHFSGLCDSEALRKRFVRLELHTINGFRNGGSIEKRLQFVKGGAMRDPQWWSFGLPYT